jgi:hypothetical protein
VKDSLVFGALFPAAGIGAGDESILPVHSLNDASGSSDNHPAPLAPDLQYFIGVGHEYELLARCRVRRIGELAAVIVDRRRILREHDPLPHVLDDVRDNGANVIVHDHLHLDSCALIGVWQSSQRALFRPQTVIQFRQFTHFDGTRLVLERVSTGISGSSSHAHSATTFGR